MVYIQLTPEKFQELNIKPGKFNLISLENLKQSISEYNNNLNNNNKNNNNKNENNNKKKIFLHEIVTPENIIMDQAVKVLEQEAYEDPPEIKREKQERINRVNEMKYQQMVSGLYGVKPRSSQETVKSFEKSMSFGTSFIFSFFLSGLSGYYFGLYILELPHYQCLILGAVALVGSLILETTLYIVKILKDEKIQKIRKKEGEDKQKHQRNEAEKLYDTEYPNIPLDEVSKHLSEKVSFLNKKSNKTTQNISGDQNITQRNKENKNKSDNKEEEIKEKSKKNKKQDKKNK
ncbi:hypothetical protein PPERSA_09047 [Pseudocohnilembus persalinus]|uniref:Endoplasmic reticulum-based factor for assembly of V-ATPase-domain-containing protein n=1 Tax=Pseudocohnilembus persalinus TaxID=266149 RepID=A0A0V0R360_PSEPJ|nr:hypothetical protein PPERSA_09047 [Pseudocohnilembus persalinus]|eukprot:KRX08943.1 hypothetical protein PPERSA_09047 [Pseudocohnilembus persalinus]